MIHSFTDKLEYSMGEREKFDIQLLRQAICGCVGIKKTDTETDKTGIDYIATLRGGAQVFIDAKTREPGARRYWRDEPELALEKWSVVPTPQNHGKTGWTLSEESPVDMILYTFDKSDCDRFFILPFQHLRMAFVHNVKAWERMYPWKQQRSGSWRSEAMFVPASVVLDAVMREMTGKAQRAAS